MSAEMNADPRQIQARVDALLADLPVLDPQRNPAELDPAEIDGVGRRLEQAHQVLLDALESVEKG